MSDHLSDLDLGGSFALGPWRVRPAGYGAMQLASDGVFGPPRDRDETVRAACRGGPRGQPHRHRAVLPGYIQAATTALSYPWRHFIDGHLGRLGTRNDITLHQQYIADIEAGARQALATVDPTPYFQKYGENPWAAVRTYLNTLTDRAAAPVIAKYTGVLAASDIAEFTTTTTFQILQSIRLDPGPSSPLHP